MTTTDPPGAWNDQSTAAIRRARHQREDALGRARSITTSIASRLGCGVLVSLGGDIAVGGVAPERGFSVGIADICPTRLVRLDGSTLTVAGWPPEPSDTAPVSTGSSSRTWVPP